MIGRDEVSAILDPQISYKNLVSVLFIILVTRSKWLIFILKLSRTIKFSINF